MLNCYICNDTGLVPYTECIDYIACIHHGYYLTCLCAKGKAEEAKFTDIDGSRVLKRVEDIFHDNAGMISVVTIYLNGWRKRYK